MDREQVSNKGRVSEWLQRLRRNTRGATAIEYGLIISLVVLAMLGALMKVANVTTGMWNNVSTTVINAK